MEWLNGISIFTPMLKQYITKPNFISIFILKGQLKLVLSKIQTEKRMK